MWQQLRAVLAEAVAAIDGAVAARLERQFRHAAAIAAGGFEHLALRAIVGPAVAAPLIALAAAGSPIGAAASLRLTRVAASRATSGVVGEALLGVEVLFASRESELRIAIRARQGSIGIQH